MNEQTIQRARLWAEQEMQPFVDLIIRARSTGQPSYLLANGELQQVDDGLGESSQAIVRECEGRIAEIIAEAERMAGLAHRSTGLCSRSFQKQGIK